MVASTSFAFDAPLFLLMVRAEGPLVPRAMFGILNTLPCFPSGASYPVSAFSPWRRRPGCSSGACDPDSIRPRPASSGCQSLPGLPYCLQ
jgi:hypothetical protein